MCSGRGWLRKKAAVIWRGCKVHFYFLTPLTLPSFLPLYLPPSILIRSSLLLVSCLRRINNTSEGEAVWLKQILGKSNASISTSAKLNIRFSVEVEQLPHSSIFSKCEILNLFTHLFIDFLIFPTLPLVSSGTHPNHCHQQTTNSVIASQMN